MKGKQKQILTYGHHATVSLFGCVDIRNGEFLCMEANRCNAQTFLTFLRYVLATYENQQIIMILGNAKIHHAKLIQPFLHLHKDSLTLVFFATLFTQMPSNARGDNWKKSTLIH